jgi:hypothetical protein
MLHGRLARSGDAGHVRVAGFRELRGLEVCFPELGVDFIAIGASVELLGRDCRRRRRGDRCRRGADFRRLHFGRRRLRELSRLRRRRRCLPHRAAGGLPLLVQLLAHRRADRFRRFGFQRAFRFGFCARLHRLLNPLPQRLLEMFGLELTGVDGGNGGGGGMRGSTARRDAGMDGSGFRRSDGRIGMRMTCLCGGAIPDRGLGRGEQRLRLRRASSRTALLASCNRRGLGAFSAAGRRRSGCRGRSRCSRSGRCCGRGRCRRRSCSRWRRRFRRCDSARRGRGRCAAFGCRRLWCGLRSR